MASSMTASDQETGILADRESAILARYEAPPLRRIMLPPPDAHELVTFGASGSFFHVIDRKNVLCKVPWQNSMDTQRFEVEKRVFDRLGRHPHIVKVLTTNGKAIYMKEYRFQDLRGYFESDGHSTVKERITWCKDIAETLEYIHSKGVRHGSLSCRKILLNKNRGVRICGFGGASIDGEKPLAIPESGSRHPDRAECEVPTIRAELHSLGSVLYEIMTRERVHKYLDVAERDAALERGEYPDVGSVHLGEAIDKCWRGEYPTAKEAAADIALLCTFVAWLGAELTCHSDADQSGHPEPCCGLGRGRASAEGLRRVVTEMARRPVT
jgi:serine/threonine protein kinase